MFILYYRQPWAYEHGYRYSHHCYHTMDEVYDRIARYTYFDPKNSTLTECNGVYSVTCGSFGPYVFYVTSEFDDEKRVLNVQRIRRLPIERGYIRAATRSSRKPRYYAQTKQWQRYGGKRMLVAEQEDNEPPIRYGAQYPYLPWYDRDDYRDSQKSWKKFRKTQYKPLS